MRPLRSLPASESNAGVPDPVHNVQPDPDFTRLCAGNGVDNSGACINAALEAINHAHALEGVRPMVLPAGFAQLSVPEQLFVVVNLERADRGLPAFNGLTSALDANAQRGAERRQRPTRIRGPTMSSTTPSGPGARPTGSTRSTAGCTTTATTAAISTACIAGLLGCWGHRKGILDDFGSGPNLVMGAAIDTTGDHHSGDNAGTSMAVTLAVAGAPVRSLLYSWSQVLADLPPSSGVPGASG